MSRNNLSSNDINTISELLKVSKSILNLHKQLLVAENNKNKEEIEKLVKFLCISVEVENNLYNQIYIRGTKGSNIYEYLLSLYPNMKDKRFIDFLSLKDEDSLAVARIIQSLFTVKTGEDYLADTLRVNPDDTLMAALDIEGASYNEFDFDVCADKLIRAGAPFFIEEIIKTEETAKAANKLSIVKQKFYYLDKLIESIKYPVEICGEFERAINFYAANKLDITHDDGYQVYLCTQISKYMYTVLEISDLSYSFSDIYIKSKINQALFRSGLTQLSLNSVNGLEDVFNEGISQGGFPNSFLSIKMIRKCFVYAKGKDRRVRVRDDNPENM